MKITALAVSALVLCAAWIEPACGEHAGPSMAIREEPVAFRNADVTLHGTLCVPQTAGQHPAVVLFHGSGPEARNMAMARWFAGQGVAALAYDKRGVGESTGDFGQVAFMDLCGDGLAGIELLKARADIRRDRIGVWGLSQGGWLGPLAAARSKDVAFVIAVSGPGVTPGEQMVFYFARQLHARGLPANQIEQASALRRQVWHFLATGDGYAETKAALEAAQSKPWYGLLGEQDDGLFALSEPAILRYPPRRSKLWFNAEMNYDPTVALRQLKVPALFLFGENDELVPVPKSMEIIRTTLARSGHSDFQIHMFPGANHGIQVSSADGSMAPAPGYFDTMRDWLRKRGMAN